MVATTYAKTITLDGKRIKIDARVPRFQLDWYIPRFHVATPDSDIDADVRKLCAKDPRFTPAIKTDDCLCALCASQESKALFPCDARIDLAAPIL